MKMKMHGVLGVSSFFLAVLAGCPGVQLREPNAPVPLGEWCQVVSSKMCELTARACFNGMSGVADGCKDTAIPSCLAGRDPQTPSGRLGGDLNACLAKLEPLSCAQLGAGMGSGELSVCAANVGGTPSAPAAPPPSTTPPPTEPVRPVETPSRPRG
jgi:hypothetical protein